MDVEFSKSPVFASLSMHEGLIIRLWSILFTFILWLSLILTSLFLVLFDVIEIGSLTGLKKFGAYFGWLGIAPMTIVIFSWKFVEWACSWYVYGYKRKHLKYEK